jgi:hypothetical protein
MSTNNPYTYLSRHNIFYFRAVVLIRNSDVEVKQEYRRSLRTRDPSVARRISRVLRTCVDDICNGGAIDLITWKKLKELLDDHLLQLIAAAKREMSDKGPFPISIEDVWKDNFIPAYMKQADEVSRKRLEYNQGAEVNLDDQHHLGPDRILDEHGVYKQGKFHHP